MALMVTEVLEVLSRTPASLRALLEGMPVAALSHRVAEGTFSVDDVIGHLIHGEKTDWTPRIRQILASGDARSFTPFDRRGFQQAHQERSVTALLAEFTSLRAENLAFVRGLSLSGEQLALPGRHPELGPVTLGQLLTTWAVHDLNHLDQVLRVLSHRYAPGVGPWRKYLGILNR